MMRQTRSTSYSAAFIVSLGAIVAYGCANQDARDPDATGNILDVAVGEVTGDSAVIWSRAGSPGIMRVSFDDHENVIPSTRLDAGGDFTGHITATGLEPATAYRYRVTVTSDDGSQAGGAGRFRTAPARSARSQVRFLFGGDLAGQNVCRDATRGFPIFSALDDIDADFFIGLGDIIYADTLCEQRGAYGNEQIPGDFRPARSIPDFHAHWRYSFADPGFTRLRQRMAYYAVWDDHEVINDFSAQNSRRGDDGPELLPMGLAAFLDYNPLATGQTHSNRLYRRFRWGEHVEIFLLDTRQYRDHKSEPDTPSQPKTMLGAEQRRWLLRSVTGSSATWKFIVTSTPLAVPTGWPPEDGRDGWADDDGATGFERELLGMLETMRDARVANLVWLAADVHFASGFRFRPFADSPEFVIHEFVTGPLNAGLFASRDLDVTMNPERLFFHGPEDFRAVADFDEAIAWMNIGLATVDETGILSFELLDGYGRVVATQTFEPRR